MRTARLITIPNRALCKPATAEHSSQQGTGTARPNTIPYLASLQVTSCRAQLAAQGMRTAYPNTIPNRALCKLAAAEHSSQQGTRTARPSTIPNIALCKLAATEHSSQQGRIPHAWSRYLTLLPCRLTAAKHSSQQGTRTARPITITNRHGTDPLPGYSGGAIDRRQTPAGGDPAGNGLLGPTCSPPPEANGLSGFSQGHTGRASPVHRACVPPRTHSCSTHNCRHDLNQEDS